jgi:hypothetical protein
MGVPPAEISAAGTDTTATPARPSNAKNKKAAIARGFGTEFC